jgi:hypothetical protein
LGKFDEATSNINDALTILNPEDPVARLDAAFGHMSLGKVAYAAFDYDNAAREFELAKAMFDPSWQFEALIWLSRATMFEPDQRAVDYAEQAIKVTDSSTDAGKALSATARTLRARALFNHGNASAALTELQGVLKAQGGLTLKVNVSDLVTRSDLVLAAMLAGNKDRAREYLAYTGAGRYAEGEFSRGVNMIPPPCGGEADLQPDDVGVVEFAIRDDGAVINVSPIYASRNGPVAAEFARAVAGWSWKPEEARKIPQLFRFVTRIELRCSTATAHPEVLASLFPDFTKWLNARHVEPYSRRTAESASLEAQKAELGRREGHNIKLDQVPVLMALASNRRVTPIERQGWLRQARDILARADAPVTVLTYLDAKLSDAMARSRPDYVGFRSYLRTLLAVPATAADPRAAGVLRLMIAESHYGLPHPPDAENLLSVTSSDPGLDPADPIRIGALVRLASLQAASKNLEAARTTFAQTGLTAQQCTLIDAAPTITRMATGEFPREAQVWGFNGWVTVEFDITADGKTTNQRAVIAYPPLIFRDAAVQATKSARYEQTYRPESGLGCGGSQMTVGFKIAN